MVGPDVLIVGVAGVRLTVMVSVALVVAGAAQPPGPVMITSIWSPLEGVYVYTVDVELCTLTVFTFHSKLVEATAPTGTAVRTIALPEQIGLAEGLMLTEAVTEPVTVIVIVLLVAEPPGQLELEVRITYILSPFAGV